MVSTQYKYSYETQSDLHHQWKESGHFWDNMYKRLTKLITQGETNMQTLHWVMLVLTTCNK